MRLVARLLPSWFKYNSIQPYVNGKVVLSVKDHGAVRWGWQEGILLLSGEWLGTGSAGAVSLFVLLGLVCIKISNDLPTCPLP